MFRRGFLKRVACCVLLPLADLVPLPQLAAEVKKPVIKEYTVCLMTGYEEAKYPGYSKQKARFLFNEEENTLINIEKLEFPAAERGEMLLTGVEIVDAEGNHISSGHLLSSRFVSEGAQPVFAPNSLSVFNASIPGQ